MTHTKWLTAALIAGIASLLNTFFGLLPAVMAEHPDTFSIVTAFISSVMFSIAAVASLVQARKAP